MIHNKMRLRSARCLHLMVGLLTLMVHICVIFKILPYEYVNGGRTKSFNEAEKISKVSSIAILFITFLTIGLSYIRNIKQLQKFNFIYKGFKFLLIGFWSISLLQQILGTIFEKLGMSFVCLVGLMTSIRLLK